MTSGYPRAYSTDKVDALLTACSDFDRRRLRLGGKLAAEIFDRGTPCGSDSGWVALWCRLGELLVPLFYELNAGQLDSSPDAFRAAQSRAFAFAGSPDRLIYSELDDIYRQTTNPAQRGKEILRDLVMAVDEVVEQLDDRLVVGQRAADDGGPLAEAEVSQSRALVHLFRTVVLGDIARLVDAEEAPPPEGWTDKPKGEVVKRVWLRGLADLGAPLRSLPGVMLITKGIASLTTNSGIAASFDDNDPFSILSRDPGGVPVAVARRFADGAWLIKHRADVAERYNYHHTGIRDPGTTELDRIAFKYIFDGQVQRSFVVLAPTSSGKSRLGQLAVIEAVHRAHREGRAGRVVVLVPTKALVNQAARDFRRLLCDDPETSSWSVFEGSRDYPQFDDRIRNGRFDIAVCIPEKVSALLRVGMSLSETSLVVVDELQHLVDESRGPALELLMIELFRDYPHLRWIGLSASLSVDTQDMVERWFERNHRDIGVHRAESRPVPVVLAATDGDRYVEHSPDQVGSEHTGVLADPPFLVARLAGTDIRDRHIKGWALSYARTLGVICAMLKSSNETANPGVQRGEVPSILVFVSSRRAAENLPIALEAIASLTHVLSPIDPAAQPYLSGRYQPFDERPGEQRRSAEELLSELELTPPGSIRRQVTAALISGIGFHTSTLDGHARETVEEAFRQGYIRVMFATDTLKLGVNLPADIVVNADLILNTGSGQRLMDKDAVIQRFGRAGRLGVSRGRRGAGYLVVPDRVKLRDASAFEIGLDERIGLTGNAQSVDSRVLAAVSDIRAAFRCYLSDLDGGARYNAVLNDAWLYDAVVRLLCGTSSLSIDTEDLRSQAQLLFESSFSGVTNRPFPRDVVERLESAGAVRTFPDGTTRVTRLGRIAAGNALGLSAASTVASIAEAAIDGAGPLTLLYVACLADAARPSSFQMVCEDRMSPGQRKQVLQVAAKLGRVRRESPGMSAFFRLQDHANDLFGTGRRADELKRLLTEEPDQILRDPMTSADHITAVWRATALCHWWGGSPLSYIETMVDAAKWKVDESDLRQVAESAANLLAASSDYLGTAPTDMTFRSLLVFSQEVEIGLPIVLTSLVRTNDRTMHRERLIGLLPLLVAPGRRWDQLTDLLSVYAQERDGIPRPGSDWRPLTPDLLDKIERHLQEQETLYREASFTVSSRVEERRIPAGGPTMGERMRAFQRGDGINEVRDLLSAFDLAVTELTAVVSGGHASHGISLDLPGGVPPVHIVVAAVRITHDFVDKVVARLPTGANAIAIATMGATPGVLNHSRFLTTPCAVVEPSLFLEMVARVHDTFTVESEFEWVPAEVDIEGAQMLLARMMVNNAPVLTRQDLESRLAHDKLASDYP